LRRRFGGDVVIAVLVVATIIDLALAALMIGVSGFLFGSGPESAHGGTLMAAAYTAGVIACVAAPIAGFILHRRGKTGAGVLLAWLPPAGALLALAIPAPY
jgi:hypothetical protein